LNRGQRSVDLLRGVEAVGGLASAAIPANSDDPLGLIAFDIGEGPREVHLAAVDPLHGFHAAVVVVERGGRGDREHVVLGATGPVHATGDINRAAGDRRVDLDIPFGGVGQGPLFIDGAVGLPGEGADHLEVGGQY
jgi:hypothetical protein